MTRHQEGYGRRTFIAATAATAVASALPVGPARAAAKYNRPNVASPEGQKMLASYAKGVEAMVKLPPEHPQNWFRNAFVHLMDCPHGNWWFYVWHRGFVGYFERSIRLLSGDPTFAMPYWDWTQSPEIPAGMFDGALSPTSGAFEPYTGNLARFTAAMQPALGAYWNGLSQAQRAQLDLRGYKAFGDLWNDVTGYSPAAQAGISGNEAFATTCASRYLTRDNPRLDPKTAYDVSPPVVIGGLLAPYFHDSLNYLSFTSAKTPSHNASAGGPTTFSILEGFPHNKVHNYIGGVGPLDPGPYGNMTNFLSPVDPIFFLHHSNMDRLWDVWTRKQKAMGQPFLPADAELQTLSREPFLFFTDGKGGYVGPSRAGDYLSTDVFEYDYQPGFGEDLVRPQPLAPGAAAVRAPALQATISNGVASVSAPRQLLRGRALTGRLGGAAEHPLVAAVTLPRPTGLSPAREFDVLVNAPPDVTQVSADSPYYAGTITFFGPPMPGMAMTPDATFTVPLPRTLRAFDALGAAEHATLTFRLTPSHGGGEAAPPLKALSLAAF